MRERRSVPVSISELWRLATRADFTRRESTSTGTARVLLVQSPGPGVAAETVEFVGLTSDNAIDTNRYGVRMDLTRRITRHLQAGLRYSYNKQQSRSRSLGSPSDFDNHLVTLGIQYEFDQYSLDRHLPW